MSDKPTFGKKESETPAVVKAAVYKGVYRMVDKNAVPIILKDGVYQPNSPEQIAFLEEQVKRGLISKE